MFKKLQWISVGAFLLCLVLPGLSAANNITVKLAVRPDSYTGTCPVAVTFRGRIAVSEPSNIKYKFFRSDGSSSEEKLLRFTEPGWQDITTTWTLSGSYAGWMTIKLLSPQVIESERAEFKVVCQAGMRSAGRIIAKKGNRRPAAKSGHEKTCRHGHAVHACSGIGDGAAAQQKPEGRRVFRSSNGDQPTSGPRAGYVS